ncbi:MAG: glycine--tRNA ligase subunit beta [Candidatus Manganitrophus sp.]|nr:MAG: glycine--tRNA ligase subunit beta [Candidatus Manganitrophus sp.]
MPRSTSKKGTGAVATKKGRTTTAKPKGKSSEELLVEIGVEEIPSNIMAATLQQLREETAARLAPLGIPFDPPQVYGTPRRLILYLPQLAPQQETRIETISGPAKKVGFDPQGNPTSAALGFAKSQGAAVSELKVRQTEKGEYLFVEREVRGEATVVLLKKILPEIFSSLDFPRSMRWNGEGVAFVRPIRWIVALYGGEVVPFSYAGVKADRISYGHRILSPEPFRVADFSDYRKKIRKASVLIDPKERYDLIVQEMARLAAEKKGRIEEDETLVWQAAFMVEYPKAVCGSFDLSFLEVPKEVIIAPMKEHQGYFPLEASDGKLLPNFITIVNNPSPKSETIRKGNERVLRARLVDAKFYFEKDRKSSLRNKVDGLTGVTFQEKLGTLFEKTQRLIHLSNFIVNQLNIPEEDAVQEAAMLCKADLVAGVVREFPSLQGTMGKIYAEMDGRDRAVAAAIEEHYLPRYSGGALPGTPIGQVLAVADKLDTIVGCFGVGLIPSGSEDPYALRRQGLGLIQILVADGSPLRPLSLQAAISESIRLYEDQRKFSAGRVAEEVNTFLKQRVASYLQSEGVRYDLIDAVLARKLDRPHVMVDFARALVRFSTQPLFGPLMISFKRAIRILPKGFSGEVNVPLLKENVEKELHEAIHTVNEGIGDYWTKGRYEQILEMLATLYVPLNRFFEGVMVMDPNEEIRENRLSLLSWVRTLFNEFGDFSKIVEGESSPKPEQK